jgi:hypothetical protein
MLPLAPTGARVTTLVPTYARIEPYRRYNFAIFKSYGLAKVFDTLRHDRAFLVRPSDVATLMRLTPATYMTEGPRIARLQIRLAGQNASHVDLQPPVV